MTHTPGFKFCSVCQSKYKTEDALEELQCPNCGAGEKLMRQARKFKEGEFTISPHDE